MEKRKKLLITGDQWDAIIHAADILELLPTDDKGQYEGRNVYDVISKLDSILDDNGHLHFR